MALFSGCAGMHEDQFAGGTGDTYSQSAFTDVPEAVRETVHKRAPGARIAAVAKQEREGRTIYQIAFTNPKRFPKLWIAEDGTFLSDKDVY